MASWIFPLQVVPIFQIATLQATSTHNWASLVAQTVKNMFAMWETCVQFLGWEDPLEEEMATHSSVLARKILWTEDPGGLQSMGLQRVRHDWETNTQYIQLPLFLSLEYLCSSAFSSIPSPQPHVWFFYANILDFYWFLSEEGSAMGISTGNSNAGISANLICMNNAWTPVQSCICIAHLSCSRRVPLKAETSSLSRWRTF